MNDLRDTHAFLDELHFVFDLIPLSCGAVTDVEHHNARVDGLGCLICREAEPTVTYFWTGGHVAHLYAVSRALEVRARLAPRTARHEWRFRVEVSRGHP